jgi:hypothetical protein
MEAFREEVLREVEEAVMANGFFAKLPDMTSKDHLAWCASLYHVSKAFAALLQLRYQRFQNDKESELMRQHYDEEVAHAAMLRDWLIDTMQVGDPELRRPTLETENLISALVREAAVGDKVEALLTINAVGEGVAVFLFSEVVKQFTRNGFENLAYWVMHAQNDEQHSDVFPMIDPESVTAEQLAEYRYRCSYILSCFMSAIESWARL